MSSGELTIDLAALVANYKTLAARAPRAKTSAVLKANAYGLGIEPVALALSKASVNTYFVFDIEEGIALRKVLSNKADIYLFGDLYASNIEALKAYELIPSLNRIEDVHYLQNGLDIEYALAVDTGMNRLGLSPSETASTSSQIRAPKLIYSHLYAADSAPSTAELQKRRFLDATSNYPNIPRSLAATSGILRGEDYHFDLTRPGIGLFGGARFENMRNVVTLSLPVRQIRDISAGETIGYDGTYRVEKPMRVATLAGGYADGILRSLSNRNCPLLAEDGTLCPLIGRVSMDSITVDISALTYPPKSLDLYSDRHSVLDVARYADTISYELLTSLGNRFSRKYINAI